MDNNSYNVDYSLYLNSFQNVTTTIKNLDLEKRALELENEIKGYEKKIEEKGKEYKWDNNADRNKAVKSFEIEIKEYNAEIRKRDSELQNIKENHLNDKDERHNKINELNIYRQNIKNNAETEFKRTIEQLNNEYNNEKAKLVKERNSLTSELNIYLNRKVSSNEDKVIIERLKKEIQKNTINTARLLKNRDDKIKQLESGYNDFLRGLKNIDPDFNIDHSQNRTPQPIVQPVQGGDNVQRAPQPVQDNNVQPAPQTVEDNIIQPTSQPVQNNNVQPTPQPVHYNNTPQSIINSKSSIKIKNGKLMMNLSGLKPFQLPLDSLNSTFNESIKKLNVLLFDKIKDGKGDYYLNQLYSNIPKYTINESVPNENRLGDKMDKIIEEKLGTKIEKHNLKGTAIDPFIYKSFQINILKFVEDSLSSGMSAKDIMSEMNNYYKCFGDYVDTVRSNQKNPNFSISYDVRKGGLMTHKDFSTLKDSARNSRGFADVKAKFRTRFSWGIRSFFGKMAHAKGLPDGSDSHSGERSNPINIDEIQKNMDEEINNVIANTTLDDLKVNTSSFRRPDSSSNERVDSSTKDHDDDNGR